MNWKDELGLMTDAMLERITSVEKDEWGRNYSDVKTPARCVMGHALQATSHCSVNLLNWRKKILGDKEAGGTPLEAYYMNGLETRYHHQNRTRKIIHEAQKILLKREFSSAWRSADSLVSSNIIAEQGVELVACL